MATLRMVLAQVEGGRGQAVGIVGEPGMGKSRLLEDGAIKYWRKRPLLRRHCLSYGIPPLPARALDLLRAHCGITPTDGVDTIEEKVRGVCRRWGWRPREGPVSAVPAPVGAEVEHWRASVRKR